MNESSDPESSIEIINSPYEVRTSELDDYLPTSLIISNFIEENSTHQLPIKEKKKRKKLFISFIPNNSASENQLKARVKEVYSCDYEGCMKKYKSNENLKLHKLNKHEKQKPYQCSYCTNKFSHRNGKRYHETTFHTKLFPCQCNCCCHKFATTSLMKAHFKQYHQTTQETDKAESDK